jgi:hypothetical protein
VNGIITKDEARRVLETELRSRKLAKPMTLEELNVFCEEMYKRLEFKSHSERLGRLSRGPQDRSTRTPAARGRSSGAYAGSASGAAMDRNS